MLHNIIIFLPLITLIVMALITKRMAESMTVAMLLAMFLLYKQNILTGTIEMLYGTLTNPSFQFILIILLAFGSLIKLLQDSGALVGFGNWISRFASGPKRPLILAWLMAFVMFVDDYLNVLTVCFSLKNVTDRNKIPREHLAFQSNSIASCICVLVPFSSWAAFTVALVNSQGVGFAEYVKAVPFMFYPLIIVVLMIGIALGVFPKVGTLKESYERVANGGPTFLEEKSSKSLVNIEMAEDQEASSALNAIIPMVAMVVGVLIFDNDLAHGALLAIAVQFFLYVGQKIMTVEEFVDKALDGAKSMCTLTIITCFGFTLSQANQALGLFDLLIGGIGNAVPSWVLPAVVFLVMGFTTFATGGCWIMQVIAVPIFIPIALATGVPPELIIAPMMSGVTMGYGCCFYADAVFMASAGTGVSNLRIIKTSLPYALGAVLVTTIGYLIVGAVIV